MKKAIVIAVFAVLLGAFAFQALAEDTYYYLNLNVMKVYPTVYGYKLVYRSGLADVAELYIPNPWFSASFDSDGKLVGSKAEVIYSEGPSLPYATVFYKNNMFSHIKLFLVKSRSDPSYGRLEMSADLADKFKVDDLKLAF